MRPRTKGAWVMAGLVVLGAIIAGGGEARADTGITIGSGGVKPVTGDPPYDYIFQVYLEPGSSILSPFDPFNLKLLLHPNSFTIDGLVGVTSASLASPIGQFGSSTFWCASIDQTSSYDPNVPGSSDKSNVTWSFLGTEPIPMSGTLTQPYLLGTFTVETTDNYPNGPPMSSGTQVNYSFTAADSDGNPISGGGIVTLMVAPEPSSAAIVLLTGGTAALGGLAVRTRRRRKARG
jgi:hypothetical protein